LEEHLVNKALQKWTLDHNKKAEFQNSKLYAFHWKNFQYALRCNIARHLTGESFRSFSVRLADSNLFQWFTRINTFSNRKAISKSTLERYSKYFDNLSFEKCIHAWQSNFLTDAKNTAAVGLNNAVDCGNIFMDTTCVKANIHFPVDWVLLRDAVRSLISAIKTIRAQGLKHRITEPALLMRQMNKHCIEMTHTRRRKDSKKQRKAILRKMKKVSTVIKKHAIRYKEILIAHREETNWTQAQANQVIARIDNILTQLPDAITQAHERIIGQRQVSSNNKILSLYEPDVHVIVRGKAGGEIEFGNGLLLTEQQDGIIIDWQLFQDQPQADSKLLEKTINRIEKKYGAVSAACADRGFFSKSNKTFLENNETYDAICPKSPNQLLDRLKEPTFIELQTRRSQTEARIGIFKNIFLGKPLRSKGFLHKQLSVSWCILTHNLWVIARMALADEKINLEKVA